MWLTLLSAAAATGIGAAIVKAVVGGRADRFLADGIRQVEEALEEHLGGAATVTVEGDAVTVLMGLRKEVLPAGRVVVERARLPNGLAVRHGELTTVEGQQIGHLVVHVTARAISEQLGVPGLKVMMHDDRLRLAVGMASITVNVKVVDSRVVLSIPVAPPPIGSIVSAGLTELVPAPPEGVELHDVRVVGRELVIRAVVDMQHVAHMVREQQQLQG